EGDEQQEGGAYGGIRFAIDVFAHDVAVGSYPEDGVVSERHDDHAEDDGDINKLERTQTGEADEESQAEHGQPGGGVEGDFTHAAALAPFKIEKLAEVVGAGESGFNGGSGDASQYAEQRQEQRLLRERKRTGEHGAAEQIGEDVARKKDERAEREQADGQEGAQDGAEGGDHEIFAEIVRGPIFFDSA